MNNEVFQLAVVGINYRTSTIFDREIFQINRKEIPDALRYFKTREEVESIIIISTCNRLEFYLVLKKQIDTFSLIDDFYFNNKKIHALNKKALFYTYFNDDVAKCLFYVISGLDSMVLGEYQIQGQIKESYSIACTEKTVDKILHKLFHAAFRTGKNVRNQTKIGSGKQSLSGVAFQIISENLKKEDAITIVGVNENTRIIAESLNKSGFSNLVFVNRTIHKAEELANKYKGVAYSLNMIEESLTGSKCLFSCTGSPGYVITSELLKKSYSNSKYLKLIIDMAVPRDIDTFGLSKNIKVFDLEELKIFLEKQKNENALDLPLAERIISDEVNLFKAWNESQGDDPLASFAEQFEQIRLQILEENKIQFSEEEFLKFDKLSHSLIHRLKATFNQAIRMNSSQHEKNN